MLYRVGKRSSDIDSRDPSSVIAKTLVVRRKPSDVIEFFLNLKNWEGGRVPKNVTEMDTEWWETDTPLGRARIRLLPNRNAGHFGNDFVGGGGEWMLSRSKRKWVDSLLAFC